MEIDIKKVISGLEHCIPDPNKSLHERTEENECRHAECPYGGKEYQYGMGCFWSLMSDALVLLKCHDKQVQQWTKEIADNQLAHAPDELDRENWDYKKGIWDGLQIAWNIISEGR